MSKTQITATGFFGDKLYQKRARKILPILVRQAKFEQPLTYENLAKEIHIPNPRNLNYPLGCIGDVLNELSLKMGIEIPHIQALVKNKHEDVPGKGFDGFLKKKGYKWANSKEKKSKINLYWREISAFPYWDEVLKELGLTADNTIISNIVETSRNFGGGGEGPEHKALKEYIQSNPQIVGLTSSSTIAISEYSIPSGDTIDVVFDQQTRIHAVEVKSSISEKNDIARGLFQCVKYLSVLKAKAIFEGDNKQITVCLAIGGEFPTELIPLKNSLGIEVYDLIKLHK